jgi:hypothetical protein
MKITSPTILQPTWPKLTLSFAKQCLLNDSYVIETSVRELTYCEFPSKWCWDEKDRSWKPRQARKGKIGCLYYVHPSAGEILS